MFEISPIIAAFFSQTVWLAVILSLALIPILKLPAERLGLVDNPGGRKKHKKTATLVGGPAIFLAFIISLFVLDLLEEFRGMMAATVLLFLIGVIDDKYDISATIRLVLQAIIISVALWFDNVWIQPIQITDTLFIDFGLATYPFTVLVIIALKNAINMLDGMDGLSSGVAIIALGFLIAITQYTNQTSILLVTSALMGATLGFWAHNYRFKWRSGASVFMGDSGSMLIGFLIPYIAIKSSISTGEMITTPSLLIWFVAIPVWDIITVVFKRIRNKTSPLKPGRDHIHHTLLNAGLEVRQILHLVYLLSLAAGAFGMMINYLGVSPLESFLIYTLALGLYVQRVNSLDSKHKSHIEEMAVLGRTLEKVVSFNKKRAS